MGVMSVPRVSFASRPLLLLSRNSETDLFETFPVSQVPVSSGSTLLTRPLCLEVLAPQLSQVGLALALQINASKPALPDQLSRDTCELGDLHVVGDFSLAGQLDRDPPGNCIVFGHFRWLLASQPR